MPQSHFPGVGGAPIPIGQYPAPAPRVPSVTTLSGSSSVISSNAETESKFLFNMI